MAVAAWGIVSLAIILWALKDATFEAPTLLDYWKAVFIGTGPVITTIWFFIDDLRRDP